MRVVLGGTFDPLHRGHKALFERSLELSHGDQIIIGLTSDTMANEARTRAVAPYLTRKQVPDATYEIIQINEVFNKSITQERDADAFVVSEGRKHVAEETNAHRQKYGRPPLDIITVSYVLAQDGLPIKATRIAEDEIDSEGKLLGTVHVAVGTNNDVKVQAVKNIFGKVFDKLNITKALVSSGVPSQPWGSATILGAKTRAAAALNEVPEAHFGVGIEAGLFEDEDGAEHYDIQYCAIHDRGGRITVGHGPGFYYPHKVVEGLKAGRTVGQVMAKITDIENIGHKQGAIGYLTKGLLTREGLTEQAVIMALVPRLTELYE